MQVRLIALLAGLSVGLSACSGVSEGQVDVLTYNVAGLPEGLSGSQPARFMPLISPRLNRYELVLVQEDFSFHRELEREAFHAHRSVPLEPTLAAVNDGLNRFSDFPLGVVERRRWVACFGTFDNSSDCLSEKGFSFSSVALTAEVSVDVYNFHAEAGGGDEDEAARAMGYDQLADFIVERSTDRPLIVTGDTNLHDFDEVDEPLLQRFMQRAGLTDACRALDCGDDRIDRVFVRSTADIELTPIAWRVADEFVSEDGEPLSDHEAVNVTLSWTAR